MTDQTQTTTEPVLLPCPFCGGEAWLNDYEAKHSDLPPQSRAPQCRSCGVSPGYLPTAKKAIAAWNTRTTPQPLAIGLDSSALTGDKGRKLALRLASEQVKPTTHEDACCCGQCMAHETALDTAKSTIKAILALAAPAEGYVLVPVEPTEAMIEAGRDAASFYVATYEEGITPIEPVAAIVYRAMIAACLPAAPTGETGA